MFGVTNGGLAVMNDEQPVPRLDSGRGCVDIARMARRLPSVPFLLAIATAFGVSSTVQAYLLDVAKGTPPSMVTHLFALNLVYWYVPALLAPAIMTLAVRVQPGRVRWPAAIGVHVAATLTYAVVHTAVMVMTHHVLMPADHPARGWFNAAQLEFLEQLDWMLMTYLFLVGLALALVYRRESEARTLDAAHLETRLVEAQLQALQRQLHPHFLFNTLNTISGLMRTDVNAADRMMDRLAELLRATLHASDVQEVTLRDELDLLQKYVDIEETRFGSRLTVHMHVDPDTLDARVPVLLLQPLVENAVRHGIVPHARPGVIDVNAGRVGDRLCLTIRDSGRGVPGDRLALLNSGVGLSNTRARLRHLYRADHEFSFANVEGGFCVTVAIPLTADRDVAAQSAHAGVA